MKSLRNATIRDFSSPSKSSLCTPGFVASGRMQKDREPGHRAVYLQSGQRNVKSGLGPKGAGSLLERAAPSVVAVLLSFCLATLEKQ
jgi:hypothetical protein